MSFSDEDDDIIVKAVGNYLFVDDQNEPLSFNVLPIQWNETTTDDLMDKSVFLDGFTDGGNQKVYVQVIRWKFEMFDRFPRVLVLAKDGNWIRLLQPRKSFVDVTRTILVTLHFLHFVRRFPDVSGGFIWDQLFKVFSFYEVRPSEKDLTDHLPLIREAAKQDDTLSKSQFLAAFLEIPAEREGLEEDVHAESEVNNSNFIVDDNEVLDVGDYSSDEETDLFDTVCAFCDNGGDLLCCEGRCIRSFHASKYDGTESHCTSLGFSVTQVKAMPSFLCPNCEHKIHQCHICKKLGSSDKSLGAEVFQCITATCGYFYHPECVAKVLHPTDEAEANLEKERISAGESFTCPAHKCCVCKLGENKDILELQFAVCRRCPKSYHRKCLPSKIVFDNSDEDEEDDDVLTRAWPNMLPYNRILIYCLRHKIDRFLRTPARDHIIFPPVEDRNRKLEHLVAKKRAAADRRTIFSDDWISERSGKVPKQDVKYDIKHSLKEKNYSEKHKMQHASVKLSSTSAVDYRREVEEIFNCSQSLKSKDKNVVSRKYEGNSKGAPAPKEKKYQLDIEAKNRIITMVKNTESLVTVEDIKNGHKVPSTCANSLKTVVDKTITLGKVEGFVEAIRTAVQKLDAGASIEEAKAVCGPDVLKQIIGWKKKLTVYLAPFLHGNRYTSFGRHFTKLNKLQEIVDKLHWYTENGDTIVDFCCGSNDFSWLMKDKLEETKKSCHFRNFDIIHPKNDFCFERRDWMTVGRSELPVGDNLIMGLNPPFGTKASLANQFIEKALQFNPKLVILIVPPETQRLDRKGRYDLIWEDKESLAGKAFYLPGSVDMNNKQIEQWNNVAPPLSLWSRSDWTKRHKKIALNHNHVSKQQMHTDQGRNSGNYYKEEGPRQFQPSPSIYSGTEARQSQPGPSASSCVDSASEASEWTYPGRRETAMKPPQHYERRSKLPGQNPGGDPSFSSASNQTPAQHTSLGGGPSLSTATNQVPAQQTGYGGGLSFSSISNQAPAKHSSLVGGPLFSSITTQVPAQHTGYSGGLLFSSTSNQAPAQHSSFGGGLSFSSTTNQVLAQHAGYGGGLSFSSTSNQAPAQHSSFGGGPSFSSASNPVPAQHTGYGGGPSFSSTSNQAPAQHSSFGGGPSFSSASNPLPAQHTGYGGGPSFSSTSNQAPAQHTRFGLGPSFSSTSNQAPAQHTRFCLGPSFFSTSNQVPGYDVGFGSLDPLPSAAPYQLPSYNSSSYGFGYQAGLSNSSESQYGVESSLHSFYPSMSEFAPGPPKPPFQ